MSVVRFERAEIAIAVKDPALARAIESAIASVVRDFPAPPRYPIVKLRTFRRLAALAEADRLAGRLAIVRVTERGLRRLPALVEALRARAVRGVQLVWDGETPPRARAEATVFRVLEAARATKSGPPVVLAASPAPALALRALVAARGQA